MLFVFPKAVRGFIFGELLNCTEVPVCVFFCNFPLQSVAISKSSKFFIQTNKFTICENYPIVAVPIDSEDREDRYPATLSFPDAYHAFVSNGFGQLTMYHTSDRSTDSAWEVVFTLLCKLKDFIVKKKRSLLVIYRRKFLKNVQSFQLSLRLSFFQECLSIEPLVDAEVNSFVIVESRSVGNKFDVLLRCVVPGEKSNRGNFLNKAAWLSVISGLPYIRFFRVTVKQFTFVMDMFFLGKRWFFFQSERFQKIRR